MPIADIIIVYWNFQLAATTIEYSAHTRSRRRCWRAKRQSVRDQTPSPPPPHYNPLPHCFRARQYVLPLVDNRVCAPHANQNAPFTVRSRFYIPLRALEKSKKCSATAMEWCGLLEADKYLFAFRMRCIRRRFCAWLLRQRECQEAAMISQGVCASTRVGLSRGSEWETLTNWIEWETGKGESATFRKRKRVLIHDEVIMEPCARVCGQGNRVEKYSL